MPTIRTEAYHVNRNTSPSHQYRPNYSESPVGYKFDLQAPIIQDSLQVALGVALALALSFALVGSIAALLSCFRSFRQVSATDDDDSIEETIDSPYSDVWLSSYPTSSTFTPNHSESRPTSAPSTVVSPVFDRQHLAVSSHSLLQRSGDSDRSLSGDSDSVTPTHDTPRPTLNIVLPNRPTTRLQLGHLAPFLSSFNSRVPQPPHGYSIFPIGSGRHSDYIHVTSPDTPSSSNLPESYALWDAPELSMFPPPYHYLQPAPAPPHMSMDSPPSRRSPPVSNSGELISAALPAGRPGIPSIPTSALTHPCTYTNAIDEEDEMTLAQMRRRLLSQGSNCTCNCTIAHSHCGRHAVEDGGRGALTDSIGVELEAVRCPASPPPSYQDSV
ncbi:hypothetical protein C2E23DRAFT_843675 [Lenzites betulinus]|nr:hypothetical protein C2E23DRAFT_843675 [Lenzites betulinus]